MDVTSPSALQEAPDPEAVPFLSIRGLQKRYGGVTALRNVNLDLHRGQVLALVGDNGAGKSTLIKTVAGVVRPDEGEFRIDGETVTIDSPHAATSLGIATVYQDLALCENLDVVANLFLGAEVAQKPLFGVLRRVDEPAMERRARDALASLSVNVPALRRPVAGLSGGQRQAIAVARALLGGAELVVLDEPTAALGVQQTKQVLALVRRLAEQGHAVLLISHSLPDVFSVADRICVLRLGLNAGCFERDDVEPDQIVAAMTGSLLAA
jgi:D-xylose transport system ATP-binding protein